MKKSRRDFLKKLGIAGGAGLVVASSLKSFAKPLESLAATDHAVGGKVIISILQTTDVHCQVHAHDELFWEDGKAVFRKTGGYAQLDTYFQDFRKKHPHTFIIDTGDMFQGSELSVKTTGKAMVPILNQLNYDLYLPGNWEVIYYKAAMQSLLGALNGPKVCANMHHDLGENRQGDLIFPPYYIWEVAGIRIGFIGYTDPLVPIRQSPSYSKGIIYTKPEDTISHYSELLRNQEKCAFVCVVAHLGLSQQIHLANLEVSKGVDYILGGDTHERVRKPIQCKYSKVVEPGAFGSFVGRLDLTIENGKVVHEEYTLDEVTESKYKPSTSMLDLIRQNEEPFSKDIFQVVGYSTIPLYRYFVVENPIDTMIVNALRWKLPDIDIVLSNGFRFCPPRTTPDATGNIPITNGFIYDMLPVDSTIRTASVTGYQLYDWLEKELNNVFAQDASERFGGWVIKFNGMKVKFNAYGKKGNRVEELTIQDMPLDLARVYSICACEREGDPLDMLCRMKNVSGAQNTPYTLHTVMREYLQANSPVTPLPPENADVMDAPQSLLTQVTGVDYQFR